MFREPDEVAADQAAAKLDQLAATRRSAIRRESSVRPGRTSSSRALIDRIRDTRQGGSNESRNNTSLQSRQLSDAERDIYELDADLSRLRAARVRQRARASQLDRDSARRSDRSRLDSASGTETDLEFLTRLRTNIGVPSSTADTNRDAGVQVFVSETLDTHVRHLPRPSRESNLRFEFAPAPQADSEQPRRPRLDTGRATRVPSPSARRRLGIIRSPPLLDPQGAGSAAEVGADEAENDTLTPGFAPAHGPFPAGGELLEERQSRRAEPAMSDHMLDGFVDTTPLESFDASLPPLRRVNHASPRPVIGSGSRIDGLGDRLRSPSPTSDAHDEENWATLLTTMDPGRSSSAATSFMSSLPDSRSGSNRSSQATTVATSFGEIGGDDSCDLDLPSGITEADVREIRARHGRLRREPIFPRPDELAPGALQRDIELARGNDRILELEVFSVILDRMQRREEIPDEWWAAVGLSPDVVRGSA